MRVYVQEPNLLRRVTILAIDGQLVIIARVVIRYNQLMASINFLTFTIKHFSI